MNDFILLVIEYEFTFEKILEYLTSYLLLMVVVDMGKMKGNKKVGREYD